MTVTEYFTRLQGKRVLVLGLGVSNRPLVRLLLRFGIDVTGCDRTPREKLDPEVLELERLGAKLHLGDDYLTGISGDVAFRTPGLHPGKPELQALRAAGTQFTSEMEAFFEVCPCRIIGVTGSDGKTTTSTLISEILKHAGHRVWTGGNIGTPLLDQAEHMTPDDLVVLELSSFQLMDLRHSCHIAVVTNLAPNHLDVHRDMAEYIDAKKHIFTRQTAQDVLILNADNTITAGFAPEAAGEVRMFSRQTVPAHGASFRDGVIRRDGVPVVRQEAFAKADKFEHVIQKATELGAAELVAFPSARCVSRPDERSLAKKLERWQKIAASAAEQSGRGRIPQVLALPSYEAALQRAAQAELAVCFYENEEQRTFRAAIESAPFRTAALLTGPEGGLERSEVEQAQRAGLQICTLGSRILRCETAPLCALSALMYATGEF